MTEVRFAHTALNCKDIKSIEKFYVRHFGFHRARYVDLGKTCIVYIKNRDVYLELFEVDGDCTYTKGEKDGPVQDGFRHIAFIVDNVDAKLKEMGEEANITQGPMGFDNFIPGWRTVWISDPEGNIVEISQGYKDQDNPPPIE